jgi:protease-4
MAKFSEYIKSIFYVILILQFAPMLFKSIHKQWNDYADPKNKVGMIYFNRIIMSSACWNKQLTQFFKDPEIKAILLKMDCPGSAGGASEAIFNEIIHLKQKYPKPIVTYIENLGASGGYQVAACTDYIVSTSSALVGSIGSKMKTMYTVKDLLENYKVQTYEFASSPYKNAGDPLTEMTSEQKKMIQDLVDDGAREFASQVAQARHLNLAEQKQWGDGKIFTGAEALKLKLVDLIGNQTTAIEYIKKQILHADREIELIRIPGPSKLQQFLHPDDYDEDEIENSVGYSFWSSLFHVVQKSSMMLC